MDQAFQWIQQLFEIIMKFYFHFTIISETEGGVASWFGKPREIRSGAIHVWLPLICEQYITTTVYEQVIGSDITVTNSEGKTIVIEPFGYYAKKVVLPSWKRWGVNTDTAMGDLLCCSIMVSIDRHGVDGFLALQYKVAVDEMMEYVKAQTYGMCLLYRDLGFYSRCKAIAIRHLTDQPKDLANVLGPA